MTDGFRWLRHAGTIFALLTLGGLIAGAIIDLGAMRGYPLPPSLRQFFDEAATERILNRLALAVLASAATVAALRGRLDALASKARPTLGILLDIDNYLRESPGNRTPRARMAERFASLLRYVGSRQAVVDGSSVPFFDRIIIVSHSQGTVIAADLLRFLRVTGAEPGLVDSRFRLVTMGSPLRQLYAQNFPHLYRWIDASDDGNADDDATARSTVGPEADVSAARGGELTGRSPSPLWLGVTQWVNLFTTGDYIGRTLWRREAPATWQRQGLHEASTGDKRRERCLGAGTHTRYWTSPDVAWELDAVIAAETPPSLPCLE